jgi:hypothetical protein
MGAMPKAKPGNAAVRAGTRSVSVETGSSPARTVSSETASGRRAGVVILAGFQGVIGPSEVVNHKKPVVRGGAFLTVLATNSAGLHAVYPVCYIRLHDTC